MTADEFSRAGQWIVGDDTGVSSKTIWAVMTGLTPPRAFHNEPSDPDDLGRCLRLLEVIPEWKARLGEMAAVSKGWEQLVKHWDTLAACMAEEVGIDWSKGRSASGTYGLMRLVREGQLA